MESPKELGLLRSGDSGQPRSGPVSTILIDFLPDTAATGFLSKIIRILRKKLLD